METNTPYSSLFCEQDRPVFIVIVFFYVMEGFTVDGRRDGEGTDSIVKKRVEVERGNSTADDPLEGFVMSGMRVQDCR